MYRIVTAARAFMSSVLDLKQLKDPLAISLLSWLDSIANPRYIDSSQSDSALDLMVH